MQAWCTTERDVLFFQGWMTYNIWDYQGRRRLRGMCIAVSWYKGLESLIRLLAPKRRKTSGVCFPDWRSHLGKVASGEQQKSLFLSCVHYLYSKRSLQWSLHRIRVGSSQQLVNAFELKKKLHFEAWWMNTLAPQRGHRGYEEGWRTPATAALTHLKATKSGGICQICKEPLCVLSKPSIPFSQGPLCCCVYTQTNKCLTFCLTDEGTVCAWEAYYFKKHKWRESPSPLGQMDGIVWYWNHMGKGRSWQQ